MIKTEDNSNTLYSKEFDETYHSVKDGALNETLNKHITPAFEIIKRDEVKILDICFGLGYNSLASILYSDKKLDIISPEIDRNLVESLRDFSYPKEFEPLKEIIESLSKNFFYKDERVKVEIIIGDAREYLKNSNEKFDIIYQDPFSPKKNPLLWTYEYFEEIKRVIKREGVLTTYSISSSIRYALYQLGFNLYTHKSNSIRKGTIASLSKLDLPKVDFEEKLKRVTPKILRDNDFLGT